MPETRSLITATAVVLAAVAALAGCATQTAGTPATTDGPPPSSSFDLPPRPQEIDLTGYDPCQAITPEQAAPYDFDGPPRPNDPDRYGNARCVYGKATGEEFYDFGIGAVTQEDMTVYLDGTRRSVNEIVTIAGFPGLTSRIGDSPQQADTGACFATVSTKPGQYLTVQTQRYGDDTVDELCDRAAAFAALATETLIARQ